MLEWVTKREIKFSFVIKEVKMKKFMTLTLLLFAGLSLTGCFGEDTDQEELNGNDEVRDENGTETSSRQDIIEESGLEIGTGTGKRDDPYIIDINDMQTGNITDYVVGTPSLYYAVPAAPGKTYTGRLIVTSTSVERTPFWADITMNDGTYTVSDANRLDGLDLVGQDIVVSLEVSEFGKAVNFNITTNAFGEDVFYEFYVEED